MTYFKLASSGGGGLSIWTGYFTAPVSAVYAFSFGGLAYMSPGQTVGVQIHKNGESLGQSALWYTSSPSDGASTQYDVGSIHSVRILTYSSPPFYLSSHTLSASYKW